MKRNLTASQIKWIALVTMFIDHFGAVIIENYAVVNGISYIGPGFPFQAQGTVEILYAILRGIGRLAFPLYIFLLVEGFRHTKDIKKYIMRMGLFAIISEIPFNLALFNNLRFPEHQNVFFTLTLGLIMLYILDQLELKKVKLRPLIALGVILLTAFINEYIGADYGGYGIIFIALIYLFRNNPIVQSIVMSLMGLYQFTAVFSGVITYFYSGRKGKSSNKWFYYIFYPAHLLLLYLALRIFIIK